MDLSEWAGLAATTFVAALLYTMSGFGFALLAAPLYLMFVDPTSAIQLVIIISTALSVVVVPGLRRAVAPWLLLRLVRRAASPGCRWASSPSGSPIRSWCGEA